MNEFSYFIAGLIFAAFIAFAAYKIAQPKQPTGGANDNDADVKDGQTRQ
jgi:hypothetical protein